MFLNVFKGSKVNIDIIYLFRGRLYDNIIIC